MFLISQNVSPTDPDTTRRTRSRKRAAATATSNTSFNTESNKESSFPIGLCLYTGLKNINLHSIDNTRKSSKVKLYLLLSILAWRVSMSGWRGKKISITDKWDWKRKWYLFLSQNLGLQLYVWWFTNYIEWQPFFSILSI